MRAAAVLLTSSLIVPAGLGAAYVTEDDGGNPARHSLFALDLSSRPQVRSVGNLGTSSQVPALAFDFATETMYGVGLSALYTVSLQTGMATEIGPTGIGALHGLAIRSSDGAMYGMTLNGQLCGIDRATGRASAIGSPSGVQITALAFAPDGRLLACAGSLGPAGMYRIDPATGGQTLLFTCPTLSGMAVNPQDGQLYGVDNFDSGAYRVNLAAHSFQFLGRLDLTNPKGLSFTPTPPTTVLIALGCAATCRRRASPAVSPAR